MDVTADGDDNDIKLVRASASLLADLEASLPKLWWKSGSSQGDRRERKSHSRVKQKDLTYVVSLVRPVSSMRDQNNT